MPSVWAAQRGPGTGCPDFACPSQIGQYTCTLLTGARGPGLGDAFQVEPGVPCAHSPLHRGRMGWFVGPRKPEARAKVAVALAPGPKRASRARLRFLGWLAWFSQAASRSEFGKRWKICRSCGGFRHVWTPFRPTCIDVLHLLPPPSFRCQCLDGCFDFTFFQLSQCNSFSPTALKIIKTCWCSCGRLRCLAAWSVSCFIALDEVRMPGAWLGM